MAERLLSAPLPPRLPASLAERFRGVAPAAPEAGPAAPRTEGEVLDFWVVDVPAAAIFEVRASLRLVTPHTYWYVQQEYDALIPRADLQRSATFFEDVTRPGIRAAFGPEPEPGVDGDPRTVFLLARVPGVAAYFSGVDSYPRSVNPRSNERDMIYVNLEALRPGQASLDSTLAHEFQHMVHFARCPVQETWVDEGSAELAARVIGFGGGSRHAQFASRPAIQLTHWTDQPGAASRHYQAAYLFLRYVVDRFGGPAVIPDLLSGCDRGVETVQRFLDRRVGSMRFHELFADWTVANLVNDRGVADGRFGYIEDRVQVVPSDLAGPGDPASGVLPQYGADYVELRPGTTWLEFAGSSSVPLLPLAPPSGSSIWWSNRADSLDSTLTRAVDLRGVGSARLRFKAWYDVEERFDFAYLAASRDGGATWETLPGLHTQRDEALGNDYGVGWTGGSRIDSEGPVWVDEEVDLSPFAGTEILLRFEYVTDQGYNARGFALDDLVIEEIGLFDNAESDGSWFAHGWLRVDSAIPQQWSVRLVQWRGGDVSVMPIQVDPQGRATVSDIGQADRSVVVIAPLAPRTIEPASYTLTPG